METTTKDSRKHIVVDPETHRIFKMACALEVKGAGEIADTILGNWAQRVLKKHGIERPR